MFPYPRRKNLDVILFTSIFSTERTLTEITLKLSFIIRTLTIFRVSNLYFIDDLKDKKVRKTVTDIINYALLPPYLKKEVPIKNTLKKVGILNPINIPSHLVSKEVIEGEYRVGKKGNFGFKAKERNKIKNECILVIDSLNSEFIPCNFYPYYTGFSTSFITEEELEKIKEKVIFASRSGKDPLKYRNEIKELYEKNGIALVIGPPQGGLLKKFRNTDYVYNFIPYQGVKDVRSEEALISSLTILNFILG